MQPDRPASDLLPACSTCPTKYTIVLLSEFMTKPRFVMRSVRRTAERYFIGWQLTRIDQFEPLPGAFRVTVKFQPEMVGSGDQGESQHGGSGERSKDVRRVVFTVINLKHSRVYSLKECKYEGGALPYSFKHLLSGTGSQSDVNNSATDKYFI